jgi:multimeric flavodoxin WrbA
MGQTQDWMNEIYPMWVAAHGIMIVAPENWYQAPSPLKLMIDRLVCADGGNADPTRTQGKDPARAKAVELEGWDYPRHLSGRVFSVIVHGDVEGAETLRRMLTCGPMPPATTISTTTKPCRKRCAMPLARCSRRCVRSAPERCWYRAQG